MGDTDYVEVLRALQEIPFAIGKKLLVAFLCANDHDSIERNKLDHLPTYGALSGYTEKEVHALIDRLLLNNLVEQVKFDAKSFWKVLKLTVRGAQEIVQPTLQEKSVQRYAYEAVIITEKDKKLFDAFDFFLRKYNDEQKKAITTSASRVLCVAGAGTGKTTTLTTRIEFLVQFRSVGQEEILAITFTRKARQEMQKRLFSQGLHHVRVETFNSFCEKILQRHNNLIYGKKVHVVSYRDKMRLLAAALNNMGKTIHQVVDLYYSAAQKRLKTQDELTFGFLNDCFTVLEQYKSEGNSLKTVSQDQLNVRERASAQIVHDLCISLKKLMSDGGMRDFTDQLLDTIAFLGKNQTYIPRYTHILVDEYQDVNAAQIQLIELLCPSNLFCVGDPRQSIFGWRGSKIGYILDIQQLYPECEVVPLVKNYRSGAHIVKIINASIQSMHLPPLQHTIADSGTISLISCTDSDHEYASVIGAIQRSTVPRHDIFVLARTNRQLKELSALMKSRSIQHIVRSDDQRTLRIAKDGEVTCATIHAIKGMEADLVFVIGCTKKNFPCKTTDHPIIDLVKTIDYDREEEELRLFYVALSRARKQLVLTYHGSCTRFLTAEMVPFFKKQAVEAKKTDAFDRLRNWRRDLAEEKGVPPYMIFHDRVLLEIAARKPETLSELQNIHGVGPNKIMKYGEIVLEML